LNVCGALRESFLTRASSTLVPAYVNRRLTFQVTSYDIYSNRYTLEGMDFIVIIRKVSNPSQPSHVRTGFQ
jgi:hypothetical protein